MFWVDDNISVHIDSSSIWIPIHSTYLENVDGIDFEIEYDSNVLELNSLNCNDGTHLDCQTTDSNLILYSNTLTPGIIKGSIFVAPLGVSIEGEFLRIKFNVIGQIGNNSQISFKEFVFNNVDLINNVQDGLVTIGECNGDLEFDDCGVCGGDNSSCEDCAGVPNGEAIEDECGVCNGDGIADNECDCSGTPPFIYCPDNDLDGLGNPNYSIESCELIDNNLYPDYILDCSDTDDQCGSEIDLCGECGGDGPDESTNCCSNSGLSTEGISPDDCGECGGNIFMDSNGFYSNGTCDCIGTPPVNYCADINGDGVSDSEPFPLCYAPSSEVFIDCENLSINSKMLNDFKISSVYPNPFNPSITIHYELDKIGLVNIKVLDVNGKHIDNIFSGSKNPGSHSIIWDPSIKISSGVYLLRIEFNNQVLIEKINYIK